MYAVIKSGGKQYRVAPGDTIRVESVSGEVGEQVKFGSILSVHTDDQKILTGDDASNATVTGKIVEKAAARKSPSLSLRKQISIRSSAAIARTIQPCRSQTSSCNGS